jgi:PKD repeat protein
MRAWMRLFLCLGLFVFASPHSYAQELAVSGYVLVSSKRITRTVFENVYRAQITNSGSRDALNVTATATSSVAHVTLPDNAVSFGNVAAGQTVQSSDNFVVRHDSGVGAFNQSNLLWTVYSENAPDLRANYSVLPLSGAAPLRVTFTPQINTSAAVISYEWDFDGNGSINVRDPVGRNVSFTYSKPGSYASSLKVTDSAGRTDTRQITIVVSNAPPTVTANAQPSNGQVPLTVSFTGSASDNEGIASYAWDFQGDGVYDYSSTTGASTSFTYTKPGTYRPVLRVTDTLGAQTLYALPTTEVRAAPTGSPSVTASASPAAGNAPLTVKFSGNATDPQGRSFTQWQWDFEGDGAYDRTLTAGPSTSFSYTTPGVFFARLRATTEDGRSAEDVVQIEVRASIALSVSTDTIDPGVGETANVITTLNGTTRVSLVIERKGGALVRTLVPFTVRPAGTYSDAWDGRDDAGQVVNDGDYYAVLIYETSTGVRQRVDLALTTGGVQYNPPRSNIPFNFSPFAGDPLDIDFTLNRASEVTAFMGLFNRDTRLVTFLNREPLGRGSYRITWNGESSDGQLLRPPPFDSFLFGIFGYTYPDNMIFVKNRPALSGLQSSPSIFSPTELDATGQPAKSTLQFNLNRPANVELVINDLTSGATVARRTYAGIAAGNQQILWDGRNESGVLLAPGRYRLGLTAIDARGQRSITVYTVQRIYF